MKSILFLSIICIAINTSIQAQSTLMNYQGVARSSTGTPLANQSIGIKIILKDGAGTPFFEETHTTTTNAFGLYDLKIGEGTLVSGSVLQIQTRTDAKIDVAIDPAGGTSYTALGEQPLNAVPYAMVAKGLTANSSDGWGIQGAGSSGLWLGLFEAGTYRGYIGSYSGKNEDVDLGTGAGNELGSLHLAIKSVPKMTIDSIGRVGVNTIYPKYRLQVDGITGTFSDNGIRVVNATANVGWSFYASSSTDMIIGRSGNLGYFNGTSGAYTSVSDQRLKVNIRPIESVLPKLMQLNVKRYEFKIENPNHVQSIGLLAQEVQQYFPEFVSVHNAKDGQPFVENQMGLDYGGMSALTIKAIQEQQAEIEDLKAELKALKDAIKAMKQQ